MLEIMLLGDIMMRTHGEMVEHHIQHGNKVAHQRVHPFLHAAAKTVLVAVQAPCPFA
jgi:hypothetical protein